MMPTLITDFTELQHSFWMAPKTKQRDIESNNVKHPRHLDPEDFFSQSSFIVKALGPSVNTNYNLGVSVYLAHVKQMLTLTEEM